MLKITEYENPMAKYVDDPFAFRTPRRKKKKKGATRRQGYARAHYDDYYVEHPGSYLPLVVGGVIGVSMLGAVMGGMN